MTGQSLIGHFFICYNYLIVNINQVQYNDNGEDFAFCDNSLVKKPIWGYNEPTWIKEAGRMRGLGSTLFRLIFSLFIVYILSVPVLFVSMEFGSSANRDERLIPLGGRLESRYIHSLELSEVEDLYVFVDAQIWLWEERVKSHNAGLPTESPRRGFFVGDSEWMRFFGGGFSTYRLLVRIGDDSFGRNQFRFPPDVWWDVFRLFPGARCTVETSTQSVILNLMGI